MRAMASVMVAAAAVVMAAVMVLAAPSVHAEPGARPHRLDEVSAQRRRPARIIVRPARALIWPGPNAKRDCVFWLQPENRPSGPVITPQQRCRWVGG